MSLKHIFANMVRPRAYFLLSFCYHFPFLGLKNECHFEFSNFSIIIMLLRLEKSCLFAADLLFKTS